MESNRRNFLKQLGQIGLGTGLMMGNTSILSSCGSGGGGSNSGLFFDISLAEWSLRDLLRNGDLDNLDFPAYTKKEYGINAVEYVSQFFQDKAEDQEYLKELKQRSGDAGVKNVMIMVDMPDKFDMLAGLKEADRIQSVDGHKKWVDAAKFLGCHGIRVNARGYGDAGYEEAKDALADGLGRLTEYAAQENMNVMVENHGGYSSNGQWLASVMEQVGHERCGTLPDFGNFTISQGNEYDPYKGVKELMPYAKGVSAKSGSFDENGEEENLDFERLLNIVREAGFSGYVGIEFGGGPPEMTPGEGVMATKKLLQKYGRT